MLTDESRARTVEALCALQTPDGGFGDGPGSPAQLGATLSVVKALGLLGVSAPRPDAICAFVLGQLDPDTGAWLSPAGEPAVLATAAGLLTLRGIGARDQLAELLAPGLAWMAAHAGTREEHFMTIGVADECGVGAFPQAAIAFFQDLALADGTGGPSVLAQGIASSALLRAGVVPDGIDVQERLMLDAQTPEGGFSDTGAGGSADLWTTYCVLRALDLRGASPRRAPLVGWVLRALLETGGFGTERVLSAGTTYQSLAVLDWATGPVLAAARAGDSEALRALLAGGDPDVRDLAGWTPLMAAAVRGRGATVEALLAGLDGPPADPDLRLTAADALPIFWAGQSGDLASVQAILRRRPEHVHARSSVNGHTVLLQAAFFGSERHRDLAEWLLREAGTVQGLAADDEAGADAVRARLTAACNVRGYTALTMTELWGNVRMATLIAAYDRSTPDERAEALTGLLTEIALPTPSDPDDASAQRLTDMLVEAIQTGLARVAEVSADDAPAPHDGPAGLDDLLATLGGLLDDPSLDVNHPGGPLTQPPLVVAVTGVDTTTQVARARQEVVALLLAHGADPDVPERHPMAVDAIIRAAVLNHFAVLTQLAAVMPPLALAAALNERPAINGQTALHDTVHRALTAPPGTLTSHLEQIRWAVAHGARADLEDLTGSTVTDHARLALDDAVLGAHAAAVLDALGAHPSPHPFADTPPATTPTRRTTHA